jgi:DNA invertase Pin-like site-specific DNA recombinase
VSTLEQAREGVSMDAQAARIAAYCSAQGLELLRVERDNGMSGKVAPQQRPGLARALEAIRRGEADGLVACKLDRLSRSVRDVLDLADDAARRGWRLVSLSETLDTESATGKFTLRLLAILAELERDRISERVTDSLAHVARQGRARSRYTPFGWRMPSGAATTAGGGRQELVPHAAEQTTLRRLVELREGGLGARRIAKALNLEGVNPRNLRAWAPEDVSRILQRLERWEAAGVEALAS